MKQGPLKMAEIDEQQLAQLLAVSVLIGENSKLKLNEYISVLNIFCRLLMH